MVALVHVVHPSLAAPLAPSLARRATPSLVQLAHAQLVFSPESRKPVPVLYHASALTAPLILIPVCAANACAGLTLSVENGSQGTCGNAVSSGTTCSIVC